MANKIFIFDPTLRDGEQAQKMHLNVKEKMEKTELNLKKENNHLHLEH